MKTTSYRSTYTARRPRSSQFKILFNEHSLTVANIFSKVFCCMKTGEVDVNCYRKMYNRWLRLQTMLLPGPDLHRVGPLAL